jgi:cellobiose phosphorylase
MLIIIHYLYETGDLAFLEENIPFYDTGEATVKEHLIRALEYSLRHLSPRGIPLRRTADWNDALTGGRLGKGESVMVAHQLAYTIKILIPVLEKIGEKELIKKYQLIYDRVKNTLNKDFWDGAWYIRATTDDGGPIGSKKNKEGKIDINAQTWSVLSGVGHFKGRDKKAMDSVWEHLNTKYGPAMFLPAYHLPSETFGIVSQFTPGTKENGAIFNHPVTWAIIAECLLGRGDKAYKYWQETSPVLRGEDPDLYKVEPYVYAEFIYGPDHPQFGRGSFTWTTGSASWYWRACLDYIIGLQPTLDGLKVEPCLPKVWTKVKVERDFRGSRYLIEINNPQKVNKGVKSIIVDDKKIKGNILPLFPNGEHQVIVEMGK